MDDIDYELTEISGEVDFLIIVRRWKSQEARTKSKSGDVCYCVMIGLDGSAYTRIEKQWCGEH